VGQPGSAANSGTDEEGVVKTVIIPNEVAEDYLLQGHLLIEHRIDPP
jgi:hypothetical protein